MQRDTLDYSWAAPTEEVPDKSKVYRSVINKLDAHFKVQVKPFSARKIFSTIQQKEETIEQYI